MRKILALLILLAIPAVAQFGGPMGGMRPGSMQGGGLLPGRGGDPLWVAAGPTKPKLDLDFAKRKDLTDAVSGKTSLVTFSRSAAQSPGTYVGSDGLIHDAAVNLALYSEQFDSTYWTKQTNASISANQSLSPDGKQTADLLTQSASSPNGIYQSRSIASGVMHTASFYFKYVSGQQWWRLMFYDGGGNQNRVWFDAINRTIGQSGSQGTATFGSATIENVGDGWFRVSVSGIISAGTGYVQINCQTGDGSTSAAAGQLLVWGAQLQETDAATMAPTAYIKTTSQALAAPRFDHTPTTGNLTTNLLLYSEQIDNSYYLKLATGTASVPVVTANQAVAPDGTQTADLVFFDRGAGTTSGDYARIYKSPGVSAPVAQSVYLKSAVPGKSYQMVLWTGNTKKNIVVTDEWQRFDNAETTSGANFQVLLQGDVGPDSTASIYMWGAQLEAASTAGTYVRTLSETRSISDANAESLGLLVELGVDRIAAYLEEVRRPLLEAAARGEFELASPTDGRHASSIVCVKTDHVAESYHTLKQAGVVGALREGSIRLSPHCYNTVEELARVVDLLRRR